jgi:hypothetical protein
MIDKKSVWEQVADSAKKMFEDGKLQVEELDKIKEITAKKPVSLELAGFWALAVLGFCIACFVGNKAGIASRVPSYPTVANLVQDTQPTPEELALLSRLRFTLIASQVPLEDVRETFDLVVKPVLRMPADKKTENANIDKLPALLIEGRPRFDKLRDIVDTYVRMPIPRQPAKVDAHSPID